MNPTPKWKRQLDKPRRNKEWRQSDDFYKVHDRPYGVPHTVINFMLPCPFCGSAGIVNEIRGGQTSRRYYPICTKVGCGCSMDARPTVGAAVKLWNRRVVRLIAYGKTDSDIHVPQQDPGANSH